MVQLADIKPFSSSWEDKLADFSLLEMQQKQIPGTWNYQLRRYFQTNPWQPEDFGIFNYHFDEENSANHFIELKFCISGNTSLQNNHQDCNNCQLHQGVESVPSCATLDVVTFRFEQQHLTWLVNGIEHQPYLESILNFKNPTSFSFELPICNKIRNVVVSLFNNHFDDVLGNIFINAQTQILLLYCLETIPGNKSDNWVGCKFLNNFDDREKIIKAREVLLKHIGDPITIKELSRKVAINECYLKKGFKEIFGTTIFDFYQSQRMEHARYLLYEKGLSVSEVSALLGYSYISHFSTAFKKHTGLKPCELLVR